jgi:hypothetical protein
MILCDFNLGDGYESTLPECFSEALEGFICPMEAFEFSGDRLEKERRGVRVITSLTKEATQ